MSVPLRPLRFGEILDRAVRLYRDNFLQYIGIVALVQLPVTLVQIAVSITAFSDTFSQLGAALNNPAAAPDDPFSVLGPSYFVGASLNTATGILGFILVQGVATAALTASVGGSYLGEPTSSIWDAYRRIRTKWVSVVGALLLAVVLALALSLWWLVPCAGWFTGGGMLLFLWYVIVPLLAPIIILEDGSPTGAWRRAWMLARRRFWWVLGFALVLYAFNLLVVAGPAAIVSVGGQFFIGNPLELSSERFTLQTVVQALTVLITGTVFLPLQVASMTLLYFDLRVRTEGLDLVLATEAAVAPQSRPRDVLGTLTAGDTEPLLAAVDWRNFLLLTMGAIVGFLLLYGAILAFAVALIAAVGPL